MSRTKIKSVLVAIERAAEQANTESEVYGDSAAGLAMALKRDGLLQAAEIIRREYKIKEG